MPEYTTDLTGDALLRIDREQRAREARKAAEAPVDCQRCGWLLEIHGRARSCPMGHYRWED
ncbi:MAG: hypothetical protein AB7G21_08560 [Dehalococcoidia bacterium]